MCILVLWVELYTVDREIIFRRQPFLMKIKHVKYMHVLFMTNIFNVEHFLAMKIRLRENFTSKIFYW